MVHDPRDQVQRLDPLLRFDLVEVLLLPAPLVLALHVLLVPLELDRVVLHLPFRLLDDTLVVQYRLLEVLSLVRQRVLLVRQVRQEFLPVRPLLVFDLLVGRLAVHDLNSQVRQQRQDLLCGVRVCACSQLAHHRQDWLE